MREPGGCPTLASRRLRLPAVPPRLRPGPARCVLRRAVSALTMASDTADSRAGQRKKRQAASTDCSGPDHPARGSWMGKFLRGVRRWVGGWSAGHDQGVEAYIHGRLDEAERRFSSLVRQAASSWPMAPRVVIVRNNLAATWEAQGRSGDAERMYQDLVELWPRLALLADQPEP